MRKCKECTACCSGTLYGMAKGHYFGNGTPCHFLNKNCTIYEDRPPMCRDFQCLWLKDQTFPTWMKPSTVYLLIVPKKNHLFEYYIVYNMQVSPADKSKQDYALKYFQTWARNKNWVHCVNGVTFFHGDDNFKFYVQHYNLLAI